MAEWDTIIKDPDFQDLPPAAQQDIRRVWFDTIVLPEMREAKLPEDVITEERQKALTEYDNGQGYISSGLNSAAQGFLQTGTTALQGVGAIVGSDGLEDVARGLDESVRDTFSNNPSMGKTNFVGNALGNAGAFVATMGGGGLAAKGLGLATKAGAMTGGLGVGGLAGFGGGVQQADQYGITGDERYLRGVAGAAVEVGSEMILPGGMGTELGVLSRVPGLTDLVTHPASRLGALRHGVLTEGVEEGIAQIGGNAATQMLQKPGDPAPDLTEGLGASMLGGAIGGVAFGAIMPVHKSTVVAAAAQEAAVANNDPEAAEVIAQAQAEASTKTMPVQEPKVEPLPEGDVTLQDLITPVEADRTPLTSEDLPDIEGLSTEAAPEVQPIAPEVLPEGLPQLPPDAPFLINNAPPIGEAATAPPQEAVPEIEPITPEAFAEESVLTPAQEDAQREYERKLIDTQGGISVAEAVKVFEALKALGATNADLVVNNTGWDQETGSTQAYRGSHGFVNGKETVFLNEGTMKADTVIHEAGHGFIPQMETSNPELYAQGQALVEGAAKPLMEAIAQRYARNGLTLSGKDLLHETLTTLNGNESADFWRKYVRSPKAVQAIQQWIARVREWVGRHLGSKGIDPNMTVAEFAKKVNRRILAGRMAAGRGTGASLTGKLDLNAARARVQAAAKGPTVNQQETAPAPAETAPASTNMQGVLGTPRQAATASEDISGLAWKLRPAYDRLVERTGSDSVFISDLVRESGLPLTQVKQWMTEYGINQGQATLDTGDWSHATEEQRAANVMLRDQERLYVQLHPGVGTGPSPVRQQTQVPAKAQPAPRQGATLKANNPSLWNAGATWLTQANYTGDIDAGVEALLGPDREAWLKRNTKPSEKPVTQTKRLLEWSDKARAWSEQNSLRNGTTQFSVKDDTGIPQISGGAQASPGNFRDGGGLSGSPVGVAAPGNAVAPGTPLIGLPGPVNVPGRGKVAFGPFATAQKVAADYVASTGRVYDPPRTYAKVDPERAGRIAQAYEAMPHAPGDPAVAASYRAMIDETLAQWAAIKTTGLKVEPIRQGMVDPYAATPRLAVLDAIENNHLWFFPTDNGFGGSESASIDISGNPLMEFTGEVIDGLRMRANDVFRIVHDYFGHVKEGVGFRADGEENAWRSHSAMYSDLARPAMTSETRGQNSWVNFGPFAEFNKTANGGETQYAPQKTGLMPEWTMKEAAGDTQFSINDDAYMAAVKSGNVARQQAMVDAAAKAAGYEPQRVTHITPHEFTTFDRSKFESGDVEGFYFAGEKAGSTWADYAGGTRTINAYLRLTNPANISTADLKGTPEENRKSLEARGYDGVVDGDYTGNQYIVFNPEQIKSADPVTYDDQGNVIPLSQRFQRTSPDIRFSINDDTTKQQAMVDAAAVRLIESFPPSDNTNAIPNVESIAATLDDYRTFGVRDVPTALFSGKGKKAYHSKTDHNTVDRLIGDIGQNGIKSPLIVVIDGDPGGVAYVLEGGHRLAAAEELGLKTVPALVVYDEASASGVETDKEAARMVGRYSATLPQFSLNPTPVRERSGVARNQPDSLVRGITQNLYYDTQTNQDALIQAAELYGDNAGFTFEQHLKELQDLHTVKGGDYLNATPSAYFGLISRDISSHMDDPSISESERDQAQEELTKLYQVVKEMAAAGGQFVQGIHLGLKIANNPRMEVKTWEDGLPFDQSSKRQKEFEDEKKAVTRELDELAADAVKNADPDKAQATVEQHVADAIKGEAASDAGAAVLDEALGAEAEAVEAEAAIPDQDWFQKAVSGLSGQLQADIDEWLALLEARNIIMAQGGDASMTPAQRSARALEIAGQLTGKSKAQQLAEIDKQIAAKLKGFRVKSVIPKAAKPTSGTDLKGMVVGRLERHLNRLLSATAKKTPQITLQKIADAISTAMLSKAGYTGVPVPGDMATALGLLLVHKGVAASALQEVHTMLESDASTKGAITREKLKAFMQLAIGETFDTAEGVSKEAKPYGEKQLAEVLRAELRRADMNLTKIVKDAAMARAAGPALEAQLRDPERGLEKLLGEKGLNDLVSTVLAEYIKTAAERADSFRRAEAERAVRQRMKDDRQAAERFEKEKRDKELKRLNDAVRDANAAEEKATKKWNREQTAANDLARKEAEQEVRKAMTAERKAAERWEREQAASAERQTQEAVREAKQDAMSKRREFVRQRRLERIKARRAKRDAGESPDALNYDETKELLAVPGEKIIDYLSRQFGFDLKAVTPIARMEDRTRTVKAMTLKLADSLGLSTQQAEKFSQDVVAQAMRTVDAKRKAEVAKKIEQAVKTLTGRRMKSKGPLTEAQRLIRLAETGGLSAENIEQVMLKNINAKKFTPEFRAKLEDLIQKANDPHLPATSRALYHTAFLGEIQSARGIGAIGLWGEFLMSNIFFSINTFKVNFLFGGMKALADSGVMLLNTSNYVGKTEGGTRVKGLTAALAKRYLRAYAPVQQYHAKFILNTGHSMLMEDATTQFSSSKMELLANVPDTEIKAWMDGKPVSPFWRPLFKGMGYFNKYVRRIMVSTDIYHRIPAIELLKQRAVAKALVERGGVLPTSSAEWDRVLDEAMYGMPWKDAVREANRIADDAVAAGKVTKDARGIFFGETLDGMMNDTLGIDSKMLNDQMQEEGKRVTAANPTEGIFGALSNVLVNMAKNIPGFSFQMPAIRTPINFFTQSLDWTPWGFMRAWAVDWNQGKSSSVTNAMFNGKGRFKQWNLPAGGVPEGSVAEFRIKATIGTTSMLILGMALKADLDDDDDKAFFYITGKGPEDPMKNKLWREKGFRPLAMRIGGKWLAYQEMPGFAAFAWLGALSDTHRYGKPSETNTERMMYAFQRTVGSFGDAAVLKSMQDTIGAVTGNSRGADSSLEKGMQTTGNIASLALFPRIGKEVNDILFGKQDLKAGGWNARIFANIPFVPALTGKPAQNFFGEDIHQVRGGPMGEMMPLLFHRISLVEKDDPQMRFMANMGANYISTNRRFKDGRKVMEDYEFVRDWSKKSGVELRKWLTPERMEQYVRRKKADPDEAEKDFDRDVSRIRTRVLRSYHKVQF